MTDLFLQGARQRIRGREFCRSIAEIFVACSANETPYGTPVPARNFTEEKQARQSKQGVSKAKQARGQKASKQRGKGVRVGLH